MNVPKPLARLSFAGTFVWVFLIGNLFVGFLHPPIFALLKALGIPRARYVPTALLFVPYAVGSWLLLYQKRNQLKAAYKNAVVMGLYFYIGLSILGFVLVSYFSPLQFVGSLIYESGIGGVDVWSQFNPKYY